MLPPLRNLPWPPVQWVVPSSGLLLHLVATHEVALNMFYCNCGRGPLPCHIRLEIVSFIISASSIMTGTQQVLKCLMKRRKRKSEREERRKGGEDRKGRRKKGARGNGRRNEKSFVVPTDNPTMKRELALLSLRRPVASTFISQSLN